MKRLVWLTLLAVLIGAAAAGAGSGRGRQGARSQSPKAVVEHSTYCVGWSYTSAKSKAVDSRSLVWILDGAGDLKGCSNALGQANVCAGSPVEIDVFPWSHGYRKLLRDQIGSAHARMQGVRLAEAILERKAAEPGRRIVVVGHSAGCAVVMAACDHLPIDAVDRVVLLAPSVSTEYDIRPTVWSAKEGIDVFCSKKDWVALGFVVRVVGTTDNFWSGSAAGRWGFKPKPEHALTSVEASRLRQYFWSPEVAWTGNTGGHHGVHAPAFVQHYIMPILNGK